ncbi:asparagine synthase (glutamine-hydrolyzing) [Evansella cellulosilytica]|uniref:asparagine synthase (glutamine-hydrolyzing) n=1 Tax=Evansella cellulosilytica (strain ATCC 21833 / DSM 2522 / FERM P-1141 / JCM 9156 / N-4) TaxID=649639 RepID=E6TYW0_EVAC2|nr:asparagine synthase (glutamine-hydrolyzing) [Evansella cellulosilytica]ADU31295.1 asparagine synthase (glutamine-hydrolyzing) [Evansella cellulosilytica DSM 2522]
MCGFVGYLINEQNNNKTIIKNMADQIIHRGPDDEAYFLDSKIALGFRRLSIIDVDHGKQPLFNEDETKVLVFNGEIYNYKELREELLSKGHHFRTNSDSEVILHGYEEYGKSLLNKLRGMYAFVIWDQLEHKLFGARDIFGIKPFFYYLNGQEFLFSSEIKGFLPHPKFEKVFNEASLSYYLSFEYIPSSETMFRNVYKLKPGHYFEYDNGQFETYEYHKFNYNIDNSKDLDDYVKLITNTFQESVKIHEISDVEIGGFLSGGIDSSFVLHEVAKRNKIKTFSVGYEEEQFSELQDSTNFAKQIGIKNITEKVSADDFFAAVPKVQYHMDEPMSNPSAIPLYFLADKASNYVKVVLSGEGADELFGGYNQYTEALIYEKYQKLPYSFRKLLGTIAEKLPQIKGRRFLMRGVLPLKERFFRIDYVFNYDERQQILKNKSLNKQASLLTNSWFEESNHLDQLTQMQYLDFHTWLSNNILVKADRMSMAHSIELRVPFLDTKLLDIALHLPSKYRVAKKRTKVSLRQAAMRELPERTANKKKLGFPSPLASWIKQEKYYEMIKVKFNSDISSRFFETKELMKLLDEHRYGTKANMRKIWSIYCFILWYEQFFQNEEIVQPQRVMVTGILQKGG